MMDRGTKHTDAAIAGVRTFCVLPLTPFIAVLLSAARPLPPAVSVFRGLILLSLLLITGCASIRPTRGAHRQTLIMETTGYCSCGKCCGWRRSRIPPFRPVYSSGPLKGKPKKVGITASGTKAKPGTIAADTRFYPFGTVMKIPGYGYGKVEDRGGAIQGPARIDLFFKSHKQALEWGRRRVSVYVWKP